MLIISKVLISQKDESFLIKRGLLKQYLKVTNKIKRGDFGKTDFKLRKPKSNALYSFRINKQFRVFGFFEDKGIFKVIDISNHQKK